MLLMLTIGIIFQEAVKLKMGFKLQFISKVLDSQFSIYIMSLVQENIFSQLQYLKTLFTKTMPNFLSKRYYDQGLSESTLQLLY